MSAPTPTLAPDLPKPLQLPISQDDLDKINAYLNPLTPEEILQWAIDYLPSLYQTTAFGLTGLVAIDMLSKITQSPPPLIFLDTLYHFPETYELVEDVKKRYGVPVTVYRPDGCETVEGFGTKYGQKLWETDEDKYDFIVKVEPARRAYEELGVKSVITGRRASQGAARASLQPLEVDSTGLLKLNPLFAWNFHLVDWYIKSNNVPHNKLLSQGYKSVGDWHSTVKSGEGDEGERAGRWAGKEEKTECGLHVDYFAMKAKLKKEKEEQEAAKSGTEGMKGTNEVVSASAAPVSVPVVGAIIGSTEDVADALSQDSSQAPSLPEWKATILERSYMELWYPRRHFFRGKGYQLWKSRRNGLLSPPNDNPRTPDGFSYELEYSATRPHSFSPLRTIHCPARTIDDRDVLIVLLSDGATGINTIECLQHVATGAVAGIDRNHTLPLLQQLHYGNLIFGVFPLVGYPFHFPWFSSMTEAVDAMSQVLEGVAFLHDRSIAHRDLFTDNMLYSCRPGYFDPERYGSPRDFHLPRYYIIDFEWAVRFSSDSDPATRTTVVGPPSSRNNYGRAAPPEMRSGKPYCPFKSDVWQVGRTFLDCFQHLEHVPEVIDLLRSMIADDPDARPTARAVLECLNELRVTISPNILQQPIDEIPLVDDEELVAAMLVLTHYAQRPLILAEYLWDFVTRILLPMQKVPSLPEWKATAGELAYKELWYPRRHFFQGKGYQLWKSSGNGPLLPPNDDPRTPDGFSYEMEYSSMRDHFYYQYRTNQCPARTIDNRDILIVLLSDGVTGVNTVDCLQHVATGAVAGIDRNHTLPLLQQLCCGNLVFGVFPLVGHPFHIPWFSSMTEAVDAMSQILEGVSFLHDRNVAHRDLFNDNMLYSSRYGYKDPKRSGQPRDFHLPRYYIIDFEWAVRFSTDSDPATRTVVGPPNSWDDYARAAPPEMRTEKPHCPFKSDIWQLGRTFLDCFQHLEHVPDVIQLLRSMIADDPDARPTARAALKRLNELRFTISPSILQQPIDEIPWIEEDELEN
ncbi:hypothetical protein EW146_g4227 [Bondarzewia mesenterica]|uniref:Protein kinase domain-containing protein n=1 Tax=Bondarzewia mesenterica TaxID=1095465 RepID=A0A4S4LX07_9AGAM|nr:hypothetical protein EW146_g4227 [Bondarzewia mesenterica]